MEEFEAKGWQNQVCILRISPGSIVKNGWRGIGKRYSGRWILNLLEARDIGSLDQSWGFPGGSDDKESACRRLGFYPWVRKMIPWRRKWIPTPVEEPGMLQSIECQRVGHDWETHAFNFQQQFMDLPLIYEGKWTGLHADLDMIGWGMLWKTSQYLASSGGWGTLEGDQA